MGDFDKIWCNHIHKQDISRDNNDSLLVNIEQCYLWPMINVKIILFFKTIRVNDGI